jgi:hypothetical protein
MVRRGFTTARRAVRIVAEARRILARQRVSAQAIEPGGRVSADRRLQHGKARWRALYVACSAAMTLASRSLVVDLEDVVVRVPACQTRTT